MGYIHCCSALQKTKTYFIKPENGYSLCMMDYLQECPVCGHTVVQLTRKSEDNKISTVRKVNKKAAKIYEKLKRMILYQQKTFTFGISQNKNSDLRYTEFGKIRICRSNLSTLKIGLYENKNFNFKGIKNY